MTAEAMKRADQVLAEMIEVATAEEGSDLYDEWPLDLRAQVDLWQAALQPALGHLRGFPSRATALPLPDAPAADERVRLVERKHDDECGCPEEVWDTPWGELHMHLSAGKQSNACLDNGDEGERHIDLTTATVDEARAAIFGWASLTTEPAQVVEPSNG